MAPPFHPYSDNSNEYRRLIRDLREHRLPQPDETVQNKIVNHVSHNGDTGHGLKDRNLR
jgi:hypothetical protein